MLALTAMLRPKTGGRRRFAALAVSLCLAVAGAVHAASVEWFVNAPSDYDYGRQLVLPPGFGAGEFTFELWIRPNNSFGVGSTADGTAGQLTDWSDANNQPYGSSDWWFQGNFLLDGHNNNNNFEDGTFSLQFYAGGRVRWLFGDGPAGLSGGVRSVPSSRASNEPSLLDGQWHQITLVRRWAGTGATLELWIDGTLIASEPSTRQRDMEATYWASWSGFPTNQRGWYWGAEKQAAIGMRTQYEDYKGRIDEMRFWSRAKTAMEISTGFANPVTGMETGLVGRYGFDEGSGTVACDSLAPTTPTRCMTLVNAKTGVWSTDNAPLSGSGADTTAPTTPANLHTTDVTAPSVTLAWNASTDNVGVASYRISRDGIEIGSSATTSFVDSTVAANTSYTYTVRARDFAGNVSPPAGPLAVTTPAAPSDSTAPTIPGNLRTTTVTSTSVALAWNASTDNVGVTSYRISRDGLEVGSSATTSFVDTTVAANTSYAYTVRARDAAGNASQPSAFLAVSTPAAQPQPPPPQPPAESGGGGGGSIDAILLWVLLGAALRLFVTHVAGRRRLYLYTRL